MVAASVIAALIADRVFGEVPRWHPLVGFGRAAMWVEQRARQGVLPLNHLSETETEPGIEIGVGTAARLRRLGALSWCLLVIVPTLLLWLLSWWVQGALGTASSAMLGIVVLYFCIGGRSLAEHARAVAAPLLCGDVAGARAQLARIVSRDTAHLDAQSVTRATVESVLENGSDALLAPIFWFAVAGAPGVLCYRLSNTLDAMWGYRNARYLHFGRAAARIDDVLNWLPARCCALSYALVGNRQAALRCWRTQAAQCDSPNAGPVMASGAGALGVVLGGDASYGGELHWRPTLGEGRTVQVQDIAGALGLLRRATALWVVILLVCGWLA
jgi:adenosylcobinamide-phosphate synthase